MKSKLLAVFMAAFFVSNSAVYADHSGVADARYLPCVHTVEGFADGQGETLVEPYKMTVDKNGNYTIYAIDAAGNATVRTIEVNNIRSNHGSGGGGGSHGGGNNAIPAPTPLVPPLDEEDADDKIDVSEQENLTYIRGYEDGAFRPDAPITRAETATIIERLKEIPSSNDTDFDDIEGHWAEEKTIARLAGPECLRGYEDNTFRPDEPITRAEVSSLLWRVFQNKLEEFDLSVAFADIENHWAAADIERLSGNGKIQE